MVKEGGPKRKSIDSPDDIEEIIGKKAAEKVGEERKSRESSGKKDGKEGKTPTAAEWKEKVEEDPKRALEEAEEELKEIDDDLEKLKKREEANNMAKNEFKKKEEKLAQEKKKTEIEKPKLEDERSNPYKYIIIRNAEKNWPVLFGTDKWEEITLDQINALSTVEESDGKGGTKKVLKDIKKDIIRWEYPKPQQPRRDVVAYNNYGFYIRMTNRAELIGVSVEPKDLLNHPNALFTVMLPSGEQEESTLNVNLETAKKVFREKSEEYKVTQLEEYEKGQPGIAAAAAERTVKRLGEIEEAEGNIKEGEKEKVKIEEEGEKIQKEREEKEKDKKGWERKKKVAEKVVKELEEDDDTESEKTKTGKNSKKKKETWTGTESRDKKKEKELEGMYSACLALKKKIEKKQKDGIALDKGEEEEFEKAKAAYVKAGQEYTVGLSREEALNFRLSHEEYKENEKLSGMGKMGRWITKKIGQFDRWGEKNEETGEQGSWWKRATKRLLTTTIVFAPQAIWNQQQLLSSAGKRLATSFGMGAIIESVPPKHKALVAYTLAIALGAGTAALAGTGVVAGAVIGAGGATLGVVFGRIMRRIAQETHKAFALGDKVLSEKEITSKKLALGNKMDLSKFDGEDAEMAELLKKAHGSRMTRTFEKVATIAATSLAMPVLMDGAQKVEDYLNKDHTPPPAPAPEPEKPHTVEVHKDAIAGKGDGITYIIKHQLEHDAEGQALAHKLADQIKYDGKINTPEFYRALGEHFTSIGTDANSAHHDGFEVGLTKEAVGHVAYQFREEGGQIVLDEIKLDPNDSTHGTIVETHHDGDRFEPDDKAKGGLEPWEYNRGEQHYGNGHGVGDSNGDPVLDTNGEPAPAPSSTIQETQTAAPKLDWGYLNNTFNNLTTEQQAEFWARGHAHTLGALQPYYNAIDKEWDELNDFKTKYPDSYTQDMKDIEAKIEADRDANRITPQEYYDRLETLNNNLHTLKVQLDEQHRIQEEQQKEKIFQAELKDDHDKYIKEIFHKGLFRKGLSDPVWKSASQENVDNLIAGTHKGEIIKSPELTDLREVVIKLRNEIDAKDHKMVPPTHDEKGTEIKTDNYFTKIIEVGKRMGINVDGIVKDAVGSNGKHHVSGAGQGNDVYN